MSQLSFSLVLLMDPWSYSPDGRGVFFANEFDLSTDSFARNRKPSNFLENGVFMSEFADRDFSDMVTKTFHGKSDEFIVDSTRKLASSCLVASNLLSEENESSSRFPSLPEVSGIDLGLRRPMDYMNSLNNDVFENDTPVIASASPAKKPRAASSTTFLQKPLCQVYGCSMDLSSSKDYHRRHRVCEAHSKTSIVIVNGIEQRFCQQCSRFHLLKEFDDRKRSCRRRLAGHNERRRKPAFYFIPGRGHKVPRPSQGNKFLGSSLAKDFSLVLPEAHPASLLYRIMDEQNRHAGRFVKFEDEYTCCPQASIYAENEQDSSRNHLSDLLPKRTSHSDPAISSKEATAVSSSNWELHEASRSSCALSLLSAQSQHDSQTPSAIFSKGPRKDLAKGVHSTRATPIHNDQMGSLLINRGRNEPFVPGSHTVDLLQLSSHLQRVEQQRSSSQVKQECSEPRYHLLGSQVTPSNQRFGN